MKILKFLIVALGLFIAQGVFAVTLPSTSYYPHSGMDTYTSGSAGTDFSVMSGDYISLGAGESYDECASPGSPGVPKHSDWGNSCEDCCDHYFPDDDSTYLQCVNACEQGASLPLDAPLWFMLVIAVLSVTLRAYARRVSQAA